MRATRYNKCYVEINVIKTEHTPHIKELLSCIKHSMQRWFVNNKYYTGNRNVHIKSEKSNIDEVTKIEYLTLVKNINVATVTIYTRPFFLKPSVKDWTTFRFNLN